VKPSVALTALTALTLTSVFVRAQGRQSTRDGVYTETQAARGRASYMTSCASCHGEALQGSGAQNPALVGKAFLDNWTGDPLDALFERIQTSMPADHPGTLVRTVTADIVAYILKSNKLPAGKKDLPTEADALKQIQFDAPK